MEASHRERAHLKHIAP
jgi:hypothetical protein